PDRSRIITGVPTSLRERLLLGLAPAMFPCRGVEVAHGVDGDRAGPRPPGPARDTMPGHRPASCWTAQGSLCFAPREVSAGTGTPGTTCYTAFVRRPI